MRTSRRVKKMTSFHCKSAFKKQEKNRNHCFFQCIVCHVSVNQQLMFFFLMFKLFVLLRALWEGLRRTECNLLGSKIPVPSVKQRRILLIQQVKHVNTQSLFPLRVYRRAYFFPDSSNSQYVYVRERKDLDVDGRKIWVILARSSPETSCAEKSGVLRVKDYKQSVALESDGGCGTRGSTWWGIWWYSVQSEWMSSINIYKKYVNLESWLAQKPAHTKLHLQIRRFNLASPLGTVI